MVFLKIMVFSVSGDSSVHSYVYVSRTATLPNEPIIYKVLRRMQPNLGLEQLEFRLNGPTTPSIIVDSWDK